MNGKLYWTMIGALAFWLPVVLLSALYRWNVSTTALNVGSLTGLGLVALVSWATHQGLPSWWSVLAGIYIAGPAAMLLASAFTRMPPAPNLPGDWIWRVLFCLLPPMTIWLATLNGMILSVFVVTIVLPLLALSRRVRAGGPDLGPK